MKQLIHTTPRLLQKLISKWVRQTIFPVVHWLWFLRLQRFQSHTQRPNLNKRNYDTTESTNQAWSHMLISIMIGVHTILLDWIKIRWYFFDSRWRQRSCHKYPRYRPWLREWVTSWRLLVSRWRCCWYRCRLWLFHKRLRDLNETKCTGQNECNGNSHEPKEGRSILEGIGGDCVWHCYYYWRKEFQLKYLFFISNLSNIKLN